MGKEYEVIRIDQLSKVSDTRGLVSYYRHKIRTKGGIVLSVDIDEENFTQDKAVPILRAAAENADAILKS